MKHEYIIEFEESYLENDDGELCLKSKSVTPIVRCADCIHASTDGDAIYCRMWDRWEMPPTGYCHYGNRKK